MKKVTKALTIVAMAAALAGCVVGERPAGDGKPGPDDVDILLTLRTPGGFSDPTAATRALTYAEENTIRSIHVLVFDPDDELTAVRKAEITEHNSMTQPDGGVSGRGEFKVTLSPSDEARLVVLANLDTVEGLADRVYDFEPGEISLAEAMAALTVEIEGTMYAHGGAIVMWGETELVEISQNTSLAPVPLTRAVARVDVGVGRPSVGEGDTWSWNGRTGPDGNYPMIPFELTEVYVYTPLEAYSIVPDRTKLAAGSPTIPPDGGTLGDPFVYSAEAGFSTRDIYLPEAAITALPGGPGDENYTRRMALVVGGYYNGNRTAKEFYRIDFARDGDLIDVLRNHLYQFNISGVAGHGYGDPRTAYESMSMNMTVEVIDWNETEMTDIVWEGQQYLAFSERPTVLTAGGGERSVTLRTNVPTGFAMTLDGGGSLAVPTVAGGWSTYTGAGGNFDYKLTLVSVDGDGERTYSLDITFDPNFGPGAGPKTDLWRIAAGEHLTTTYEVRQLWSITDPRPYPVTLVQTEGGTTLSTHESATEGTFVTLMARSDAGRMFTGWMFDGKSIIPTPDPLKNPLTFAMPAGEVVVTPGWEAAEYFDVTIDLNNVPLDSGTAEATPNKSIRPGEIVWLRAQYDTADYVFTSWREWSEPIAPPLEAQPVTSFYMPEYSVVVGPVFTRRYHKVSWGAHTPAGVAVEAVSVAGPNNTSARDPITQGVYSGVGVTLTATSPGGVKGEVDADYDFTGWSFGFTDTGEPQPDDSPNNPHTLSMPKGSFTATAVYGARKTWRVTKSEATGTTIAGAKLSVTFTATESNSDYFPPTISVTGPGIDTTVASDTTHSAGLTTSVTFEMPKGHVTVTSTRGPARDTNFGGPGHGPGEWDEKNPGHDL